MVRSALVSVLVIGLFLVPAIPEPVTADDFHFREYTYGASTCSGIKDPMNFYYGDGLGATVVALDWTRDVIGWTMDPLASNQWMFNDGFCDKQAYQRASSWTGNKHHTRLKQGRAVDPQFVLITASPMHHDTVVACGDVADSFNSARDYAAQKTQAQPGFFAVYNWTGNNLAIRQCDGRLTASDGFYVLARD